MLIENIALAFVICPPSLVHDGLCLIQLMANKAASDWHWFACGGFKTTVVNSVSSLSPSAKF